MSTKSKLVSISIIAILIILGCNFGILYAHVTSTDSIVLTETRRTALIDYMKKLQLWNGSFPTRSDRKGYPTFTAEAIILLKELNSLSQIDLEGAEAYITSMQSEGGGFPDEYVPQGEMYTNYVVLLASKFFDNESLNKTSTKNFILSRYNPETGAFHEVAVNGESQCYFPITFQSLEDLHTAFSSDNVISTFLGVASLALLNATSEINTTRTWEFIKACKGSNGVFKPAPGPTRFYTDNNDTGIPYTYCALKIAKILNREPVINTTQVKNYVISCKEFDEFKIHQNDCSGHTMIWYSYYATSILKDINELENTKENIRTVINYYLLTQQLAYSSWLVPKPTTEDYGSFWCPISRITGSLYTVWMLKSTNNLQMLNALTERAKVAWMNLLGLTLEISVIPMICMAVIAIVIWSKSSTPASQRKDSIPPGVD